MVVKVNRPNKNQPYFMMQWAQGIYFNYTLSLSNYKAERELLFIIICDKGILKSKVKW